jgi:hypothetical protein
LTNILVRTEPELSIVLVVRVRFKERLVVVVGEAEPNSTEDDELAASLPRASFEFCGSKLNSLLLDPFGSVVAGATAALLGITSLVLDVDEAVLQVPDDTTLIVDRCRELSTKLQAIGQNSASKE